MANREVRIVITGDASDARRAFGQLEAEAGKTANGIRHKFMALGDVGRTLTTRVTLPLVAAFGLVAKAAADEAAEIAQLDQTLKKNLEMTKAQRAEVEKQITAWQNASGFADSKLRPSLAKLVIAGRSWEQAQRDMAVAMDIARARGTDLETVTLAMSKAAQGQTTSLQRLGIQTRNAAGEALTFDEIMKNAAETMGGAASRHAQTAAGKMEILRLKMQDAAESVGAMLLPIITKLADFLSGLTSKFQELEPWQQKVIVAMIALTATIPPLLVALSLIAAHPVAAALIAVAAAVALIVLNFEDLKQWLSDNWLKIIGWWSLAIPVIEGIKIVVDLMAAAFWAVVDAVKAVIRAIKNIPSLLPDITPWSGLVPDLGFDIPGLASGGLVKARPGGTIVNVGEGGEDEVVFPVSRLRSGDGGTTLVLQIALTPTARPFTELIVADLNRAGGPKISQRAIA